MGRYDAGCAHADEDDRGNGRLVAVTMPANEAILERMTEPGTAQVL